MIDNQILANQIDLLKMALDFYADEANYSNDQIKNDKGQTARNTLKTINIVNKEISQSQYENIEGMESDKFLDLIKELKDIKDNSPNEN